MVSVSKTSDQRPPGPKDRFIFGTLSDYSRDPIGFTHWCAQEYGDVVYFSGLLFSGLQLNHPDDIGEVLVSKCSYFVKDRSLRILRLILGNGLVTSEGDLWRRQRRLMQPAFHRDRIAAYGAVMIDYANRLLADWQDGEVRDIHQDMMRLTVEIAAKTLFGVDLADDGADDIGVAMQIAIEYFEARSTNAVLFFLPDWLPTPANLRFRRVAQRMDALIYEIIQQRRASSEEHADLLSMLLQAQDEDGASMTNRQLRDEVMTLLVTGHETTANALSWTVYLLAQHPEVEAKLVEELEGVLGVRSPTVADLHRLQYTERIVMESLRLYPPVWAMSRTVLHDCEIAGCPLRPGNFVFISQWVVHRDPRFFEQPDLFNPDRWAGDLARQLPTFAYFPFGGGPRVCIGKSFAMMEAILLLAIIAQKFQFTLDPNHPVAPWPAFTLRPKYGIKMRLTRRQTV